MNPKTKTRTAVGLAAACLVAMGVGVTASAQTAPAAGVLPAATPDAALVANLTYMRQEEQLARDVYQALASKYDQAAPMVNTAKSEQRHFDALGRLLDTYGVADPAEGRAAGSFANAELQKLYDELIATGNESLAKAYEVGIAIETRDIADLKDAIAETSQADAKATFTNLLNGSENHLKAFTAAKDGKTVGAGNGQGTRNGGNANGQGNGHGQGNGQGQGNGRGAGNRGTTVPEDCPNR